jgi:hypothetical protein
MAFFGENVQALYRRIAAPDHFFIVFGASGGPLTIFSPLNPHPSHVTAGSPPRKRV